MGSSTLRAPIKRKTWLEAREGHPVEGHPLKRSQAMRESSRMSGAMSLEMRNLMRQLEKQVGQETDKVARKADMQQEQPQPQPQPPAAPDHRRSSSQSGGDEGVWGGEVEVCRGGGGEAMQTQTSIFDSPYAEKGMGSGSVGSSCNSKCELLSTPQSRRDTLHAHRTHSLSHTLIHEYN
jgi:hypothetical protein